MNRFFATCARGLEPVLANELTALNADDVQAGRGGVSFAGDRSILYQANLWLRTAVRVLQPLQEEEVLDSDQLYDWVRQIDWAQYITVDHTLAVDCNVRDSNITHSQYAARRVKDAICDQFRDKTGLRPSVNVEQPMLGLNLHISKNQAILSLDSSWNSLHKRGYRPIQTRAPLNEALAAGLLLTLGYNGSEPLVDWMCGSATFLIEGAWIAQKRAPGLTRKWFGFQGWMDFEPRLWAGLREQARQQQLSTLDFPPSGTDLRSDALSLAQANIRAAGVGHLIRLEKQALQATQAPEGSPGLLICNPPYGERLGEEEDLIPLYQEMGDTFSRRWPGWRFALFTSNQRLAKQVRVPVRQSWPFFNGSLDCKLWEFGTKPDSDKPPRPRR